MQRRNLRVRWAAAVPASLVLAIAACGADTPDREPIAADYQYVALGDSFTAVAGTGPWLDAECRRSEENYPHLIAKRLGYANDEFMDASCGGATSEAISQAQKTQGNRSTKRPQLNAVGPATKLVTLGIGLNNGGLSAFMLYLCLPETNQAAACQKYLRQPPDYLPAVIENVARQVGANLAAIRERAPSAQIVLVGYPRLLPDGEVCADQVPLPKEASERIREAIRLAGIALREAAEAVSADYVDMYAESQGHDVCSESPWVAGSRGAAGEALPFHPFSIYHRQVAGKILPILDQ